MLWRLLTEVSRQRQWAGRWLGPEDWKTLFSAMLRQQDVVPGLDGGFVVLGLSTRKLTKGEFADLLDLVLAFCSESGIEIDEPISTLCVERSHGPQNASEGHREVAA
jgi:hypothetical protein